jgi:hypothetical protein
MAVDTSVSLTLYLQPSCISSTWRAPCALTIILYHAYVTPRLYVSHERLALLHKHRMASLYVSPEYNIASFTHGDLNPFNILVRESQVVGIIDWEFSGWYPHYWKYTPARFSNVTRTEWQCMLDNILDRPRPEEFKMEEVRQQMVG